MSEPRRHPLAWPEHKARTPAGSRLTGSFQSGGKAISVSAALGRLDDEVLRLGGLYALVSTDYPIKLDGTVRLTEEPKDPGAVLYFTLKDKPYAMACDTFTKCAQNIAAIAQHIEATRRIARYGVATAEEALQAFQALPPPPSSRVRPTKPWWEVFGVIRDTADRAAITALYRAKAKAAANDGNALRDLNLARDAAFEELA